MLAQLLAGRSGARVVSISFRETPLGGGRVACGLIDMDGTIEPFALFAAWQPTRPPVVLQEGVTPPPPEPAGWHLSDVAPKPADQNSDGVIDPAERDINTLRRKLALATCKEITPPPGVHWATELERAPQQ
ncbi:hypothetical protein [Brevundimonas sp. Root1423]|uniref:hypothetical protein n=1 Tax=Brevundimonas sp. Root1423 TaxID=1736462 RepID=UPI0012E39E6F|nr:hypothetical protein [Brevundimonas sp. Root1423]